MQKDKKKLAKLSYFCAKCDHYKECEEAAPHPYDNHIWRNCEHKNAIARELL